MTLPWNKCVNMLSIITQKIHLSRGARGDYNNPTAEFGNFR